MKLNGPQAGNKGEITVEPDVKPLAALLELLDEFKIWFNMIEP